MNVCERYVLRANNQLGYFKRTGEITINIIPVTCVLVVYNYADNAHKLINCKLIILYVHSYNYVLVLLRSTLPFLMIEKDSRQKVEFLLYFAPSP